MQSASVTMTKRVWLIIFGALCASILIYGVLVWILSNSATRGVSASQSVNQLFRLILCGAAATMLIASVAFMQISTAGKIGDTSRVLAQPTIPVSVMEPSQFQTFSIIALALSEACTIIGLLLFFLGGKAEYFAFFAAGTLLVNFLLILPRGLKYWSNLEANTAGKLDRNEMPFSS